MFKGLRVLFFLCGSLGSFASPLLPAELGDINGDGRVSFGDAYLLHRWLLSGLEVFEPAEGSADFKFLECTRLDEEGTFLYMEALRRASANPLPHVVERWPDGGGTENEPPAADSTMRLDVLIMVFRAAAGRSC